MASRARLGDPVRNLPKWLKPSACVDLRLVLTGARANLRTELRSAVSSVAVRCWTRRLGLFVSIDADGFVAMSRRPGVARRLLVLDRKPGNHVRELGRLLNYPACCCRAVARVGEALIDELGGAASRRRYVGRFRAIDPTGYREGQSLISHVPCSAFCTRSLALSVAVMGGHGLGTTKRLPVRKWHIGVSRQ